jgi:hypothetical protein
MAGISQEAWIKASVDEPFGFLNSKGCATAPANQQNDFS